MEAESQTLEGKSFAITGSLEHFENRNQLKEKIEALGGKVTGSVTGKTFALINNDATSNSSKNIADCKNLHINPLSKFKNGYPEKITVLCYIILRNQLHGFHG